MSADAGAGSPQRVAVFPLNVVLFPGGLLPLRIFEPRYLRMVSECLKQDQPFAVVAIVDGSESGGIAATASTGTLARIIDWQQEDDGLLGLLCEGGGRCALRGIEVESDQLLRAEADLLPLHPSQALPPELDWMASLLAELLQQLGAPYERLLVTDPSADHVANRLIELLPLPVAQKQALFELEGGIERLRRLSGLIKFGDPD